ncbi:hypothetical protein F4560_005505 [Saccharothrix ecbatanensis]|uniref:PknH-like protein n=1 Tax=Saccharothrix ecbatanensis TaxID=1105145 RepID=A0A7W9M380_9PSEU|nr:hypothetical protein [Saccharothrix ecbatanensis]MBB5805737.1 hypothetical protein [Saccharothrix ecbatanensis]
MVRLGVVALLLATGVSGCSSAGGEAGGEQTDGEYGVLVEACDLVDTATVAVLARGLAKTVSRQGQRSGRQLSDRVDMTTCHLQFGGSDSLPIAPFDEFAPDTPGTPARRHVVVTAMRHHAVDGQSGTELARHWLTSDPQERVPDITALGLDDGDITQQPNGEESYTRIRAVDANLTLEIEYSGANIGAKPAGMPSDEGREGALRLLTDAAARRPCPISDC